MKLIEPDLSNVNDAIGPESLGNGRDASSLLLSEKHDPRTQADLITLPTEQALKMPLINHGLDRWQ